MVKPTTSINAAESAPLIQVASKSSSTVSKTGEVANQIIGGQQDTTSTAKRIAFEAAVIGGCLVLQQYGLAAVFALVFLAMEVGHYLGAHFKQAQSERSDSGMAQYKYSDEVQADSKKLVEDPDQGINKEWYLLGEGAQ